ncbi:hypothetical protein Pcinc_020749, partial [Petrolisthes cinctipes]
MQELKQDPPSLCSVGPLGNDPFYCTATIVGPPDTPYEGGLFNLNINFLRTTLPASE